MAAILIPVLEFGVTESSTSSRIKTYTEREAIGLEVPAATPTDFRGPNEHLRYLRSVETWNEVEHNTSGAHDTLQVAKLYLKCAYNSGYTISPDSYCAGDYQRDAAVFTSVTAGAAGEITVTLAGGSYVLPHATIYRVHSSTEAIRDSSDVLLHVCTTLRTITSTTVFSLRRREGTTLGGLTLTHGGFAIAVYATA
jgi:hypothetical protein